LGLVNFTDLLSVAWGCKRGHTLLIKKNLRILGIAFHGMDPFTIVTTAGTIVGVCARVSCAIYTYIQSTLVVDAAVDALRIEIDSLSQVLGTLGSSFRDASLAGTALESQTGHEGEHWRHVKRLMDECKTTLEKFERILDRVNKSDVRGILRRSVKKLKLDMNSSDIDMLKHQLTSYRRTMQLSLQLITVYVSPILGH